jgi:competence protein ComEC
MLVKLPLFTNKKEWFIFFVAVFIIFGINLSIEYKNYKEFKTLKKIDVKVLAHYPKHTKYGKEYYVLKCKSENTLFYTTTWKKYEDLTNRYITLGIVSSKKVEFRDFLSGFFMLTKNLQISDYKDNYYNIYQKILAQHDKSDIQQFYSAIFIASNIDKQTREAIATLGISHLVAISGFHLSILAIFIYGVLFLPYKLLQQNFFPYRNIKIDILIITLVVLFAYLYFVDFVPSLLRSYVMLFLGSLFVIRYLNIFSFTTLLIAIVLIIVFFPKMIFSVSFWFSVSGVFYIYLFLHYFSKLNKYFLLFLFNAWIFVAMAPIAHFYFGIFSIYQFISPFLSIAFVVFYPIAFVTHIFGIGDILDPIVNIILNATDDYILINTPIEFLVYYVSISLLSIWSKKVFILLNISMLMFICYGLFLYF